jgi:hypothetical protein
MDELNDLAKGSIEAAGQQAGGTSSTEPAMTAPGSPAAQDGVTDPAKATVEAASGSFRHLVAGDRDGEALGRWTRAGGQEWGPR